MSERDAQIMEQGTKVQTSRGGNTEEWKMIQMLDRKRELERYKKQLAQVEKGTLQVPGFMKQIATTMIEEILYTIHTTKDEKLRVSAAQDMLDRAGHGKITKSVVAHQDLGYEETKRELVNSVITLAKKAGIKVKEDDYVEGDYVDVDPTVVSGPVSGEDPSSSDPK